jgi:enoyl-CoA hydratase/carnithine racemase
MRSPVEFTVRKDYTRVMFGDKLGRNILTTEILLSLERVFQTLEKKAGNMIFLEGYGNNFSWGADIKHLQRCIDDKKESQKYMGLFRKVNARIANCTQQIVALIRGFAFGGGYELALACDFIIAHPDAKVGLPEMTLGIIAGGGGTQRLIRRNNVGIFWGSEMLLTSLTPYAMPPNVDTLLPIPSQKSTDVMNFFLSSITQGPISKIGKRQFKALKMSTRDCVEFEKETNKMKAFWELKYGHVPASFELARKALLEGNQLPIDEGIAMEAEAMQKALKTEDARIGIEAFINHEKNFQFTGK